MPKWVKGQITNPKGRPVGSKNRLTLLAARKLEDLGFDPLQGLIEMADDKSIPPDVRLSALKELMKYRYAPIELREGYHVSKLLKAEMDGEDIE